MTMQKAPEKTGPGITNDETSIKKFVVEINHFTLNESFYTMLSASNAESAEKLAKMKFKTYVVNVVREVN
ncbi:MAG: hypothetical protein HYU69_14875 [Bacteroidetes bacterium]|nr:hypothetical protein [Bacteroidota bacterium]